MDVHALKESDAKDREWVFSEIKVLTLSGRHQICVPRYHQLYRYAAHPIITAASAPTPTPTPASLLSAPP